PETKALIGLLGLNTENAVVLLVLGLPSSNVLPVNTSVTSWPAVPVNRKRAFCPGRAVEIVVGSLSSGIVPEASVLSTAVKLAALRPAGSKSRKYVPVVAKLLGMKLRLPAEVNEVLVITVPSAFFSTTCRFPPLGVKVSGLIASPYPV